MSKITLTLEAKKGIYYNSQSCKFLFITAYLSVHAAVGRNITFAQESTRVLIKSLCFVLSLTHRAFVSWGHGIVHGQDSLGDLLMHTVPYCVKYIAYSLSMLGFVTAILWIFN